MAENYTISEVLANEFELQTISSQDSNLLSEVPVEGLFSPTLSSVEFSLYDFNKNLLYFDSDLKSWSTNFDSFVNNENKKITSLNIDPSKDIETLGYNYGKVYGFYNFIQNELGSSINNQFFISEISSDRTEIRIDNTNISSESLEILYNIFYSKFNSPDTYNYFYLNFGDNQLLIATNIYLDKSSSDYSILIKLYEPLLPQFDVKSQCYVSSKIADPVAYLVEFTIDLGQIDNIVQIQGPNINLNLNGQVNNSTTYQSFDTLTSTVNTSSFNQLSSLLEEKGVEINIDYTDYSNFVFYSSAVSRLENFYTKAKQIEDYNNDINILTSLPTTAGSSGSISLLEQYISNIITNFDGYEYYLYFESGSKAWPKTNSTPPYLLASTGSTNVLNWYGSNIYGSPYFGGQLETASLYDSNNQDLLINTIPDYLNDYDSDDYLTFVKMVGQSFDNIWVYIKSVVDKTNTDNRLDFGAPSGIIADILRSLGVKIYSNNFSVDNTYESLLGIGANGMLYPTGSELINTIITASAIPYALSDVNNLTYKRLYHNLPYILKKKGTPEGLKAILNAYGVPDTILRINEFGGKDKNSNTWDQWQDEYNYAFVTTGSSKISIPFTTSSVNYGTVYPKAVEFRFKTFGLPINSIPYSQSLLIDNNNSFGVVLEYTGSGYSSGSYNGSIIDPNYQYATLKFISGSLSSSVYLPFYDGGWWSILINANSGSTTTYTLYAKNKDYEGEDGNTIGFQASSSFVGDKFWLTSGQLFFGTSSVLNTKTYSAFSGSYQEIRYYNVPLNESAFDAYVMNPYSIEGNTISGSQSSKNSLFFRLPLGGELYTGSTSVHPGITGSFITQSFIGTSSTGSYSGSYFWSKNREVIYFDQPAVGIQNIVSDKIKTINTSLPYSGSNDPNIPNNNILSSHTSIQQSFTISSSYTNDISYTEVAFSPQNEINEDIMSTLGYFNIGELIGDPRQISTSDESYPELDILRDLYFEKYSSNYDWNDYIRLVKYFDNSLFKIIKDYIPAKTSLASGVVIKQHLLERNKYPVPQIEFASSEYTGSISIYEISGSDGGSMNITSIVTQSWTGAYPSISGSVPFTQSSEDEFYNGQFSGSIIEVTDGELNDCNVEIVQVYTTSSLFININPNSPGNYFRSYNLNNDKTYYLSFTITEINGVSSGNLQLWNGGNSNNVLYTSSAISAGGTLIIDKLELSKILSPLTFKAIGPSSTGFSITNFSIFEAYTDSDCLPLLNNVIENRLNSFYMDVDYTDNITTPVNQQLILSGSATRFAIPDSNYTMVRNINPRYNGSRTTSPGFNQPIYKDLDTLSTQSQIPNASKYVNYFVYFDWIGGSTPEYPGGGNMHCTYLISTEGIAYPLTTENKNLFTVENIFIKGQKANILPAIYSAGSNTTQVDIIEGGALYDTIFANSGSTTGLLTGGFVIYVKDIVNPNYLDAISYDVPTLLTQSAFPNTLFDSGSGWLKYMLTGSGIFGGTDAIYVQPIGTNFQLFNKRTGQYASLNELVPYDDTYLPLKYGDMIRFGTNIASNTGSLDFNFETLGISAIASSSLDTSSVFTTSSLFVDNIPSRFVSNYSVQNIRVLRRVPNETFVLVKNSPAYTDPGFLIPNNFNPNFDPYALARKAGIIS
jgi:hypothetical protein